MSLSLRCLNKDCLRTWVAHGRYYEDTGLEIETWCPDCGSTDYEILEDFCDDEL